MYVILRSNCSPANTAVLKGLSCQPILGTILSHLRFSIGCCCLACSTSANKKVCKHINMVMMQAGKLPQHKADLNFNVYEQFFSFKK